ncbi:MAG: dimethylsulfonioproprionate lyase family protein [Roseovarius sp.]|uniref:dimethylsulfonioproprionate lyase family protein n=1 Tax=Roseovarius sp. TaxID=1486281 RepID=UPI0032F0112A
MADRPDELQTFLDASLDAFEAHADHPRAQASLAKIRAALAKPGEMAEKAAGRLPVCALLDEVAVPERFEAPDLRRVIKAFGDLEPRLEWRTRGGDMSTASENINEGHANAMIVGPGGIERRSDVWLGVSLLAPEVRYPDHNHPPEETYLVFSEGEFRHGDSGWFAPGVGGWLYNEPGISHAMRTGDAPMFAMWALWSEDRTEA